MKVKKPKEKYSKKVNRKNERKAKSDYSWILVVSVSAFWISFLFSFLSEAILGSVNFIVAVLLMLFFIFLGIIFDMIGISVTVARSETFHSMATKKVRGARLAGKLIKNSEKASSFCNDVIGDICGIISGSTAAAISTILATSLDLPIFITTLIITAIVASLTIGGKALGKSIAINHSTKILYRFSRVLSLFTKE